MEGLYQNKYRIKSARLPGWDYGSNAYYFVTICTHEREHYFGDVLIGDGGVASVALSEIGEIARDCYLEIPNHFEHVILDEWVIMPNHFHALIQICKHPPKSASIPCGRDAIHRVSNVGMNVGVQRDDQDAINRVSTGRNVNRGGVTGEYNPMLGKTLGTIVRWFKGRTSYECHQQNLDFHWQTRYYDSIVKNELTLNAVRKYIKNNPKMWYRDKNNLQGIFM